MTVKITKPEINIREKLVELDSKQDKLIQRPAFSCNSSGTYTTTIDYTVGTGSVVLGNISQGSKITSVTIDVTTNFDGTGPEITVGDAGDVDRLMTADESDLIDTGVAYESTPNYIYTNATDTNILAYLTVNGATQGSLTVTVTFS